MSPVNSAGVTEHLYYGIDSQQDGGNIVDKNLSFLASLRSRGYLFILLVVIYILCITLYYFSQREQHIEQLAEYQNIQNTHAALNQADLAAFNAVTLLFSSVTTSEMHQVVSYFNNLRQHYLDLQQLFPEQSATFRQLLKSVPSIKVDTNQDSLREIHFHLAKSKSELERLKLINQQRMQQLVSNHNRKRNAHIIKTLTLAIVGLVIIGAMISIFFHRLKSDLLLLQTRTEKIVNGFRGKPLTINRQDELGLLTSGINSLLQSLRAREYDLEVARRRSSFQEKMVAIDALAGGIAHEIGNPLACIAGLTTAIIDDKENQFSKTSRSSLEQIQLSITGLEKITRDISYLDIKTQEQADWLDLNTLIDNTVKIFQYDSRFSTTLIQSPHNATLSAIYAANDLLVLLLTQLIENALNAASSQQQPRVRITPHQADANHICLTVEENGRNIDAQNLDKVFEPFYTSSSVSQQSGLGLAICWSICGSLGGTIKASPSLLGGLRVDVLLPINPAANSQENWPQSS